MEKRRRRNVTGVRGWVRGLVPRPKPDDDLCDGLKTGTERCHEGRSTRGADREEKEPRVEQNLKSLSPGRCVS